MRRWSCCRCQRCRERRPRKLCWVRRCTRCSRSCRSACRRRHRNTATRWVCARNPQACRNCRLCKRLSHHNSALFPDTRRRHSHRFPSTRRRHCRARRGPCSCNCTCHLPNRMCPACRPSRSCTPSGRRLHKGHLYTSPRSYTGYRHRKRCPPNSTCCSR